MEINNKTFDEYVKMSIDSGIEPLELRFYPIIDIEEGLPFAYRTKLTVHSVIFGDMSEDKYIDIIDTKKCSVEMLKRALLHVFKAYKQFVKAERHIEFISIRCPSEIVNKISLYDLINELLNENKWFDPSKLCLEFPESLLKQDYQKVKIALLDMKLLHVKTAINGCGDDNFLLSKLVTLTPDYVFLDSLMTSYAGSRNKPQLIPSLIQYIKSMGIKTICEGIEIYRKLLRNTDAIGFDNINERSLNIYEALAQKEESYE